MTKKIKSRVAVIGYGSQGRAIALNLRDSGYNVTIGLRSGSKSRAKARKDGITQLGTISSVVKNADIVCFALPDQEHSSTFSKYIAANIREGTTLLFLHGLSVHFGLVKPAKTNDIILIAPHAPGSAVRDKFLTDKSISAFYAVANDASGKAKQTAIRLAEAIGFNRKRLVPTTFEHEAIGDLFGEQVVLCGGLAALIKNGFEVLVEKGVPAENAYLEVAYQLDLIVELVKNYGIEGMLERISVAARYGSVLSGPKVIDAQTKKRMHRVADDIISGRFTKELAGLDKADIAKLDRDISQLSNPELEKAAKKYSGKKRK